MPATATEGEIRETVRSIILEIAPTPADPAALADGTLDVPGLNLAADLGYHSLALLEVIVALEEELQVEHFEDAGAMFISTVGELEEYVLKLLSDAAANTV